MERDPGDPRDLPGGNWRLLPALGLAAGGWLGVLEAARCAWAAPRPFGLREAGAVLGAYLVGGCLGGVLLSAWRGARPRHLLVGLALLQVLFLVTVEILPRSAGTSSLPLNALLSLLVRAAAGYAAWRGTAFLDAPGGRRLPLPLLLAAAALPALAAAATTLSPRTTGTAGPRPAVVREGGAVPPNLLVVLADSVRADRVGGGLTPRLDAFAREGVALERLRTSSAWTKPSVGSLLTGRSPERHRLVLSPRALPPDVPTLLSFADSAGYRTALLSDSHWPVPEFGFDRDVNDLLLSPLSGGLRGSLPWRAWAAVRDRVTGAHGTGTPAEIRGARDLTRRFLAWAGEDPSRPFAAYLHWMEPHHPYAPSEPSLPGRRRLPVPVFLGMVPPDRAPAMDPADLADLVANYDDEVRFVDRAFGELVDGLREGGLLDGTIVVFVSDHGEEFHEHGGWTHEHSLHEEIVRIPCVLRGPGLPAGRRDPLDARIEDLLPTLLDAAGLRVLDAFDGRSLLPRWRGEPLPASPVLGRAERPSSPVLLRSALLGNLKVIEEERAGARRETWFDLAADPGERTPLDPPPRGTAEGIRSLLDGARELETRSPLPPESDLEGDLKRMLRGLGYFGGSGGR